MLDVLSVKITLNDDSFDSDFLQVQEKVPHRFQKSFESHRRYVPSKFKNPVNHDFIRRTLRFGELL